MPETPEGSEAKDVGTEQSVTSEGVLEEMTAEYDAMLQGETESAPAPSAETEGEPAAAPVVTESPAPASEEPVDDRGVPVKNLKAEYDRKLEKAIQGIEEKISALKPAEPKVADPSLEKDFYDWFSRQDSLMTPAEAVEQYNSHRATLQATQVAQTSAIENSPVVKEMRAELDKMKSDHEANEKRQSELYIQDQKEQALVKAPKIKGHPMEVEFLEVAVNRWASGDGTKDIGDYLREIQNNFDSHDAAVVKNWLDTKKTGNPAPSRGGQIAPSAEPDKVISVMNRHDTVAQMAQEIESDMRGEG